MQIGRAKNGFRGGGGQSESGIPNVNPENCMTELLRQWRQTIEDTLLGAEYERLPEREQNVIRIITLQLARPEDIVPDMLPDLSDLEESARSDPGFNDQKAAGILDERLSMETNACFAQVTRSVWEQKAAHAVNPGDILLAGGKIPPPKNGELSADEIRKATDEEAWQELHLNLTNIKLLPGKRQYEFRHPWLFGPKKPGLLKNTEYLAVGEVPPYDRALTPDQRDKLQAALRLCPAEVDDLLTDERIQTPGGTGTLIDSLSADPARKLTMHLVTDRTEAATREQIRFQVHRYEAVMVRHVLINLINRLPVENISSDLMAIFDELSSIPDPEMPRDADIMMDYAQSLLSYIESQYTEKQIETQPLRHIDPDAFVRLTEAGYPPQRLLRRIRLIDDLQVALRQSGLERTVELTRRTGPQRPYILAQMLTSFDHISPVEYREIEKDPAIKHIFDTACRAFNIDRKNERWYDDLLYALVSYKKLKRDDDPRTIGQYKALHDSMEDKFIHPLDPKHVPKIGTKSKLGRLSQEANEFLPYMGNPMKPIASPKLRSLLSSGPNGSKTSEIPELLLRSMGLSQYWQRNEITEYGRITKQISPQEQYAALRKLLLILLFEEVDAIWERETRMHIRPFRDAFDAMFGERFDAQEASSELAFDRYVLTKSFVAKHESDGTTTRDERVIDGIDVSAYLPCIYLAIREKDRFSIARKIIERGRLEDTSAEMEQTSDLLSDFFGFLMVLDKDEFTRALLADHPELAIRPGKVETITLGWQKWATKTVLEGMYMELIDLYHARIPHIERKKGREGGKTKGWISMDSQKRGSAASNIEDIDWIKYLQEMHLFGDPTEDNPDEFDAHNTIRFQTEIQWYIDGDAVRRKKMDDVRYELERSFLRASDRYSTNYVIFGLQDDYKDLVASHTRYVQDTETDEERTLWRGFFSSLYQFWIRLHRPKKEKNAQPD